MLAVCAADGGTDEERVPSVPCFLPVAWELPAQGMSGRSHRANLVFRQSDH